jgi:hypothetical protein
MLILFQQLFQVQQIINFSKKQSVVMILAAFNYFNHPVS